MQPCIAIKIRPVTHFWQHIRKASSLRQERSYCAQAEVIIDAHDAGAVCVSVEMCLSCLEVCAKRMASVTN